MRRDGLRATPDHRRYRRAVKRAFATVTFYREQCAAAGRMLAEPDPTPVAALPQPPHTLCPFARPWLPEREPSLWTPEPGPLARALRMAGCDLRDPVLEVRDALLDHTHLPRRGLRPGARYRVLLSQAAIVASAERRDELNREAVRDIGAGWVVGSPRELAAVPQVAGDRFRPVHRLPVAAAATGSTGGAPTVLFEPMLGYLGAFVPGCRQVHLDTPRVYARERGGVVTFSLPRSRRPTLLDIAVPGTEAVALGRCVRHGAPVLVPREARPTDPG